MSWRWWCLGYVGSPHLWFASSTLRIGSFSGLFHAAKRSGFIEERQLKLARIGLR